MQKDWTISLHHILREGNACAGVLVKMGANSLDNLFVLYHFSPNLSPDLLVEAFGVSFART